MWLGELGELPATEGCRSRHIEQAGRSSTATATRVVPPAAKTAATLDPGQVDLREKEIQSAVITAVWTGYPYVTANICLRVEHHVTHPRISGSTPSATSMS